MADISPADAPQRQARNGRHIDAASLEPAERALVKLLADQLGGGRLLA